METAELKKAVETLLFITEQPVPLRRLASVCGEKEDAVAAAVTEIQRDYEARGSAVQVLEIAEGFQMATRSPYAPFVRKLFAEKMTMRLSTAALETLSIIAYRQPLTRAEIEEIRGVEVIAALETLLEKRLLKVVGRKETVGRPLLYGTTPEFLRHFGLRSLADLPPFESFAGQPPEAPAGPFAAEAAVPAAEAAGPENASPAAAATAAVAESDRAIARGSAASEVGGAAEERGSDPA